MEKTELLRETKDALHTLYERVDHAAVASSITEGTFHHEIAYGLALPVAGIYQNFQRALERVDNLEGPEQYSWRKPLRKIRAIMAARAVDRMLRRMPLDELQGIHDKVQGILEQDLQGSIEHYASALSHRRGQKMSDEDKERMAPVSSVMQLLQETFSFRDAYLN